MKTLYVSEMTQPKTEELPPTPQPPVEPEPQPEPQPPQELPELPPQKKPKSMAVLILSIMVFVLATALVISFFWFNAIISDWSFETNTTVVNQVDVSPTLPIDLAVDDRDTNNYQHDINIENKINIDEDFLEDMVDDIVDGVLGGMNES